MVDKVVNRGFCVNTVVIIEHQDKGLFYFSKLVTESLGQRGSGRQLRRIGHDQGLLAYIRKDVLNRGHKVEQKLTYVAVTLIQRNPTTGPVAGRKPITDQDALTITSWSRNQD